MLERATEFTASNDAIAILDRELEGWAVGLRLVSLAVQQSKDPEGFLEAPAWWSTTDPGVHHPGGDYRVAAAIAQLVIEERNPRSLLCAVV